MAQTKQVVRSGAGRRGVYVQADPGELRRVQPPSASALIPDQASTCPTRSSRRSRRRSRRGRSLPATSTRRRSRPARRGSPRSRARARAASGRRASGACAKTSDTKTSTGVSASATCSDELTITEIAKSGRLRAASCTPTTFSTALPAIATITSPANSWLMCSVWIAGVSAVTNQSDVNAAPTPRDAEHDRGRQRATSGPARAPRRRSLRGTTASSATKTARSTPAQISDSASECGGRGRVELMRRARAAPSWPRRARQRRDHPRAVGAEPLHAVADAADEERDPEHEHAVGEDRADERRLHDVDEALVQREERDEELGQVAERRLDDARAAPEPRREPSCSVACADEARERRQGDRRDDERQPRRRGRNAQTAAIATSASVTTELDAVRGGSQPRRYTAYPDGGGDRGARPTLVSDQFRHLPEGVFVARCRPRCSSSSLAAVVADHRECVAADRPQRQRRQARRQREGRGADHLHARPAS